MEGYKCRWRIRSKATSGKTLDVGGYGEEEQRRNSWTSIRQKDSSLLLHCYSQSFYWQILKENQSLSSSIFVNGIV
jgi:hypothetical protein